SPSASTARCRAAVPEETATACSTPHARASSSSSSVTFGPIVSNPLARTSETAAASSAPTSGQARRIRSWPRGAAPRAGDVTGDGLASSSMRLPQRFPSQPGVSVPGDRPGKTLVEVDLRLEAEPLSDLLDVRNTQLDV